jgi:WD40 repeat protein
MYTPYTDNDLKMTPYLAWGFSTPNPGWVNRHDSSSYVKSIAAGCEKTSDCRFCDLQTYTLPEHYALYKAHHVSVQSSSQNPGARDKAAIAIAGFESSYNRQVVGVKFTADPGLYYVSPGSVDLTVHLYDISGNEIGLSSLEDLPNNQYCMKKYKCIISHVPL